MYIQKIEIYGYGKWVDQVFELEPGLNTIIGENEAGKTTLVSFIHSVLFGFPTKQSSDIRYEPKDSSRYGGKIWMMDNRYGLVGIERVAGKATGDVTLYTDKGEMKSDSLLNTFLYKIKKEWYQSIFSFNLDGLTDIKQMNREKLDRYFLSAGTLGSENFLKEADRLETEASKLYKPMGRVPVLNRLLKEYEKANLKLAASKEKNEQYTNLLNKRAQLKEKEGEAETKKETLNTQFRILEEMTNSWAQLKEIKALKKEVEELPARFLPDDSLFTFDRLAESADSVQQRIFELKEKLDENQQMYQVSHSFREYQDQKERMEQLEKELDGVLEEIHTLSFIHMKKETLKQKENTERIKWHFSPMAPIPDSFESADVEQLLTFSNRERNLSTELQATEEEHSFLSYKKRSIEEDVDGLEGKLSRTSVVKNNTEEPISEETLPKTKGNEQKSLMPKWLFLFVSICALIFGFSMVGITRWVLFVVGIIGMIGSGFLIIQSLKTSKATFQNPSQEENALDTKEDVHEIEKKQLRKEWQEKLAELDKAEQMLFQNNTHLNELREQLMAIEEQFAAWKMDKNIPVDLSLELLLKTKNPFETLRESKRDIQEWTKKEIETENKLEEWKQRSLSLIDSLNTRHSFSELHLLIRKYFEDVHLEEKKQQKYLYVTEQLKKEIAELVQEEHTLVKKKQLLFKSANVSNETEFRKKFKNQQTYIENKKRYDVLKKQYEKEIILMEEYDTLEELKESCEEKQLDIKELSHQIKNWRQEQIRLEASIQKLEENGEYSLMLQQSENMKSEIQSLLDEWASYKVAASLIEKTLKYAKNDRLPTTIQDTQDYFNLLTEGEYVTVSVDMDSILVTHKEGDSFHPSELSRGTAEQLYAALRFSFVKNISGKIPLPMIIDDGFVNFDEQRKEEVWKVMREISEDVQVLYFTFEDRDHPALKGTNRLFL